MLGNQSRSSENQVDNPEEPKEFPVAESDSGGDSDGPYSVLDICGKNLELSLFEGGGDVGGGGSSCTRDGVAANPIDGVYVYRNLLNLIPKSIANFGGSLKKLKFFGNEVNLFSSELSDVVGLESLQMKVSSVGLTGLNLKKLRSLKELELAMGPLRSLAIPFFGEIVGLKCLTKLSVCHFSIRFVPPEIGYLTNLEHLDLSFNKIRSLPKEIGSLSTLISLNVSNNKLMELPADMSSLKRLENLDLSTNRLTSLGSLKIRSMHNLQNLNIQKNKLLSYFEVPAWICCNLEGNDGDPLNDDYVGMDVLEATIQDTWSFSYHASSSCSSSIVNGSLVSSRSFSTRRMTKKWKRRKYLQQRARQERLASSRKWNLADRPDDLTVKETENCSPCDEAVTLFESLPDCGSTITHADGEIVEQLSQEAADSNYAESEEKGVLWSKIGPDLGDSDTADNAVECEVNTNHDEHGCSQFSLPSADADQDEESSTERKASPKSKRHSDIDLEDPKPRKFRRSFHDPSDISRKYSEMSFCSTDDRLPDGFFDAGRDRPFMSLSHYEHNFDLYSREVILVDRRRDEGLDALTLSAQAMVYNWKLLIGLRQGVDEAGDVTLQVASLLALFVSDRFGGSDKSSLVQRARKLVSGSNYCKPFVCTCSTGSSEFVMQCAKPNLEMIEDAAFNDICEKSFQNIKLRHNSCVIPIGILQFGLCRHRAILFKYLCDRMEPPVPCELIRGYLDFSPHAWNVVLIKKCASWVRVVVDACRPYDIREEADPEYFCRYTPLNRIIARSTAEGCTTCLSPTMFCAEEVEKAALSSVILCKIGSVEAAAKVRKLEVFGASCDETRQFEYNCLAEIRMLGAVRGHSCIVQLYGHRLFSEWIPQSVEKPEHRVLWSAILMEHIKGGSLRKYLEGLSKAGQKHVPVAVALLIARDVASALKELHSKHIIHRDIKSENVLIDLDDKRVDGSPVVKLCDFDRAVPLRSSVHACCIGHIGVHPPDTCVGTPRWMAPEMLRAMHMPNKYGLEVDIWSFGCMIMELLTLQIPYSGLPDPEIHDLLLSGERPPLPDTHEVWTLPKEPTGFKSGLKPERTVSGVEDPSFLVDLFKRCTQSNPTDRPTADHLYELLVAKTGSFSGQS